MHRFVSTGVQVQWAQKYGRNLKKLQKSEFSASFQGLDMAIFRAKICSTWPEMVPVVPPARYFDALICFHRCTGPWTTKNWKKVEKIAKNQFSRPNLQGLVRLRGAKIWSKGQIWCSLGSGRGFGICQPVSKCLLRFLRQLDGPKMKSSKKRHFSAPFPY